jgi:hypothetical protein
MKISEAKLCPTLKALMYEELRLMESDWEQNNAEKSVEWDRLLQKIRAWYDGPLQEPSRIGRKSERNVSYA